jgi:poly-gamma-glutamate synthesis protein (capsule biosynthesis protein)
VKGRPGLNPLRYEQRYEAKPGTIEKLKEVFKELELEEVHQEDDCYYFLGNKFVSAGTPGLRSNPNKSDEEGNLESIKEATKQADCVIFSLHAHEGKNGDPEQPAEFIEDFAREAIDAGAHAFLGHGHHGMRGIEIRNNRPIFYSLGNFIFQNETVEKMPADFYKRYDLDPYSGTPSLAYDARHGSKPTPGRKTHVWFTKDEKYWLSILPYMEFEHGSLSELKLYPIELGQDKPRSQRGRPMMTEGALADKILNMIKKLSKPYGTKIRNEEGIGIVSI